MQRSRESPAATLGDEIRADRHHHAALLYEAVTRPGDNNTQPRWQRWGDELFLHPRWGFVDTLAVFALVLVVVFEISAVTDEYTVERMVDWLEPWQPDDLSGVPAHAIVNGFVGLAGTECPRRGPGNDQLLGKPIPSATIGPGGYGRSGTRCCQLAQALHHAVRNDLPETLLVTLCPGQFEMARQRMMPFAP